jgi:hypothetical protein
MTKAIGGWNLRTLLANVHDDVQAQLDAARQLVGHPTDKGDSSESVWIDLFNTYLPRRYHTIKGHIADSEGNFSEQIDVIILDRQYTPLIFSFKSVQVVPAESVYAVFESKQETSADTVEAAKQKLSSARKLARTSGPIVNQGQPTGKTELKQILGGILALESVWKDPLGDTFLNHVADDEPKRLMDLGCVASRGMFVREGETFQIDTQGRHATRFLFKLMTKLQSIGTVPAIELEKYEPFLSDESPKDDLVEENA